MALGVVAFHAIAIYTLSLSTPVQRQLEQAKAVQVMIVAQKQAPTPRILPPTPAIATPAVSVDMPLLSLPDLSEPVRAITVAQRTAPTPVPSSADLPKLISAVEYLREPSPQYPLASRRLREEGLAMVQVLIDERGQAVRVELQRSSGYERLDRAACEAVARAKFKPYFEDGVARSALALVPIEFTLSQRVAQR